MFILLCVLIQSKIMRNRNKSNFVVALSVAVQSKHKVIMIKTHKLYELP
jgi:hypothetical protein